MLGGHVEVASDSFAKIIPHVTSGKLRVLLVDKKIPKYPDLPTLSELGYKQDLLSTWFAFYAPAGIPEEVKKVLVPAIEKAIKNPELKAKIENMGEGGYTVDYKSPSELKKIMVDDYKTANAIAIRIGLRK